MININNVQNINIQTLINKSSGESTPKKAQKRDQDVIDIKNQTDILNSQENKNVKFQELESKLGIDSSKWGVDAISDDIFEFSINFFDAYNLNHEGESGDEVKKGFYEMARSSITQGYQEAKKFLGTLPEDVAKLSEMTFERTIEKLDNWYNGTEESEIVEDKDVKKEEEVNLIDKNAELAKQAEDIRNRVIQELEKQGIYLNGESSKKGTYNYIG